MAEHVVLWTTRMWAASPDADAHVAGFLRRVVGLAAVEEAMGAVCVFRESLCFSPPALSAIRVSEAEESLLGHCWSVQAGSREAADITAVEAFDRGARSRARVAAGLLAHLLADSGLGFPCPARFEDRRRIQSSTRPFEPYIARLASGERLIVLAARVWVWATRGAGCGLTQAAAMMRRHGAPSGAAGALNHIMLVSVGRGTRSLLVKPLPCPLASHDEGLLLSAIAAGGGDTNPRIDWLPPAALPEIQSAFGLLRIHLVEAGLSVPRHRGDEPYGDAAPWDRWLAAE